MSSGLAAPTALNRDYAQLRTILNDALSGSPGTSLSDSLITIAETACRLLACRSAVVIIRDEDGSLSHFRPVGIDDCAADRVGQLATDHELLGQVIYDGQTLRVPDTAVERGAVGPARSQPQDHTRSHPPVHELIGVPIRASGEVTGGLFLSAQSEGMPFDEQDEHAARVIATAGGFLVERFRTAEQAARQQRWLVSSTELTRELVAGVHTDPMQVLVDRVLDVADADLVAAVMPSSDGDSLVIIAAAGERAAMLRHRVLTRAGTYTDRTICRAEPLTVADITASSPHGEFLTSVGVESALLVPMARHAGSDSVGTLTLFRYPGRRGFAEAELDMASTFAAQMVLALELAEARADRERAALFAERDRIARDLHDHVIQQLFAVGMTLQATVGHTDEAVAGRLHSAIDDLDQTILQIRSTIYRLTGPVLADNTLRSSVEELVRELEPMLGFRVELDVRGPVDFGVDEQVGADVIAVVRETLSNVAKHADATALTLHLEVEGRGLTLVVQDNGHGLDGATRRSGLANLRARAEQHGGSMVIDSSASGTRIAWHVPARA